MPPTIGVNLRVTGNCSQGGRKYMEDMFSVAYQQTPDQLDLEYAFFGIFDGHGGHEAASYAKDNLMKNIVIQPGFWSDDDDEVLNAIKDGFIITHYAMWRNLENWPKTPSGLPSTSGTTASIAFIRKANVYLGHVGDSGIVLGHEHPQTGAWVATQLTKDHKPENPVELRRIREAGGMVANKSGVSRVVWQRPNPNHQGPLTRSTHVDQIPFLAVARALGDLWSFNPNTDKFVVSPEPDVKVHRLDLSKDRCLIFGTDGLFNMLSAQEAVEIVEKAESNNASSEKRGTTWLNPSKFLVDHAITKWSHSRLRADNTSAVVLLLDPLGPPSPRVLCSPNNPKPYRIESYRVKEGKRPESNGLAIYTRTPTPSSSSSSSSSSPQSTSSSRSPDDTFPVKISIMDDNDDESPDSEEASSSSADTVPTLLQAISLDDSPDVAKNLRRSLRKARKRKSRESRKQREGRRGSHMSERTPSSFEVCRRRRARSEEPIKFNKRVEGKSGSDTENSEVPMRLRSAISYKTLRSRNVNLEELRRLTMEEPRSKRSKK